MPPLTPFSPIRFVYELADTGPPIDREKIGDPFAATGVFKANMLRTLIAELLKQKKFRVEVEYRRHGFHSAGSAASQGPRQYLPFRRDFGPSGHDWAIFEKPLIERRFQWGALKYRRIGSF